MTDVLSSSTDGELAERFFAVLVRWSFSSCLMSSISHLTVGSTIETKVNKRHSSFNLPSPTSCDATPCFLQPTAPTTNPNYLYYVNAEPARKQSINITHSLTPTGNTPSNGIRKLSAISLPFPWYKRGRSPSDDKSSRDSISKRLQAPLKSQSSTRMSRDRLLTLDRLFSSGTHTTSTGQDDEQGSPVTDFSGLDDSTRTNERETKRAKENGYLHNSSHLLTRWETSSSSAIDIDQELVVFESIFDWETGAREFPLALAWQSSKTRIVVVIFDTSIQKYSHSSV